MSCKDGDGLRAFERVYLERLLLASRVILELGKDDAISDVLEVELTGFKEGVELALLSAGASTAEPARDTGTPGWGAGRASRGQARVRSG